MTEGSQLKKFQDDLVTIIDGAAKWDGDYGVKPRISRTTDRKVIGLGKRKQRNILIYVDEEIIEPKGIGYAFTQKNWEHKLLATIDIQTNTSEAIFNGMVSGVSDILRLPANICKAPYMWILLRGYKNLSDQSRESWRGIIDVEAKLLDPQL